MVAGDEELGLGAGGEEAVGVVASGGADGQAEADQAGDARVAAGGAQADVRAEGEAREEDRVAKTACSRRGGAHVLDLAAAFVVGALAEAGAAEVEAQDGHAEMGEGLHGVVDDLVVHGAAGGRVRVRDDARCTARARGTGVEDGFEPADGAEQVVKGADVRWKAMAVSVAGSRRYAGGTWRSTLLS